MKTYSVKGTILIDGELTVDVYSTTKAENKEEAAEEILNMSITLHGGDSGKWVTGPYVREVI